MPLFCHYLFLFVSHLFFFWYFGKAVLLDCNLSSAISFVGYSRVTATSSPGQKVKRIFLKRTINNQRDQFLLQCKFAIIGLFNLPLSYTQVYNHNITRTKTISLSITIFARPKLLIPL